MFYPILTAHLFYNDDRIIVIRIDFYLFSKTEYWSKFIIVIFTFVFSLKGKDDSDLHQLPTFLEALLRIMNNLPEVSHIKKLNPIIIS